MKNAHYIILAIILIGCSGDELTDLTLVEHEKILSYSENDAEMVFSFTGLHDLHADLEYHFDVYEITYRTKYGKRSVVASALISVPITESPLPMISFQHGTIVAHREAPSNNLSNQRPLFSLASTGYIVVIPDFIGFGSSSDIFHPYYVAEPMGRSVADAIIAAKELLASVEGAFNGDVFLAGYSEGGYATMAAHKYIEEHPRGDINLVASAPAAGGYDVEGMRDYFFGLETYDEPFYMAFVAMAYKEYYDMPEPMSLYFQEPYASRMETLFNGDYSGGQINDQLTEKVTDFVQPDMLANFETSEKYLSIRELFAENSLTNWDPVAPIFMYHGTDDTTVPFSNSTLTFQNLVDETDFDRVTFIPLEGADHSTGVLPYVKDVYFRFKDLK